MKRRFRRHNLPFYSSKIGSQTSAPKAIATKTFQGKSRTATYGMQKADFVAMPARIPKDNERRNEEYPTAGGDASSSAEEEGS